MLHIFPHPKKTKLCWQLDGITGLYVVYMYYCLSFNTCFVSNWKIWRTPATRILKKTAVLLLPNCMMSLSSAECRYSLGTGRKKWTCIYAEIQSQFCLAERVWTFHDMFKIRPLFCWYPRWFFQVAVLLDHQSSEHWRKLSSHMEESSRFWEIVAVHRPLTNAPGM